MHNTSEALEQAIAELSDEEKFKKRERWRKLHSEMAHAEKQIANLSAALLHERGSIGCLKLAMADTTLQETNEAGHYAILISEASKQCNTIQKLLDVMERDVRWNKERIETLEGRSKCAKEMSEGIADAG